MLIDIKNSRIIYVCKNISGDIILPNSILSIDDYAFEGCQKITSINTNNVINIGNKVFNKCIRLEKIFINKITNMGQSVFDKCDSIKEINIDSLDMNLDYLFKAKKDLLAISLIVRNANEITKDALGNIKLFDLIDLSTCNITEINDLIFDNLYIKKLILANKIRNELVQEAFSNTIIDDIICNEILSFENGLLLNKDNLIYCSQKII